MSSPKDREVLYDVKPVNNSGRVDLEKINGIKPELDLRNEFREAVTSAFQEEMIKVHDVKAVLADVGATLLDPRPGSPSRRGLITRPAVKKDKKYEVPNLSAPIPKVELLNLPVDILSGSATRPKLSRASFEHPFLSRPAMVGEWTPPPAVPVGPEASISDFGDAVPSPRFNYKSIIFWVGMGVAVLYLIFQLVDGGRAFKEKVLEDGQRGSDSLNKAKADIENFDFSSAVNNFTMAYDNFSRASSRLNLVGSSLVSFLDEAPGFKTIKAARNIVKAGENISKAGETLALSLNNFYQTNFMAYFGFDFLGGEDKTVSASYFINLFKDAALFAQKRLESSQALLAQVEGASLPEDKQKEFLKLQAQVPMLIDYLKQAVGYADFLGEVLGKSKAKRYLILFQNNTELRPAGGFPGSYALIGFNRGFLREFQVDDIYNIDGQARKNIVPPMELQHITPTWGMRDANWFVNFPDSAKKVMQMYTENNGGPEVDGVITITPAVIVKILEVLGPIELPQYNLVLDQYNFLAEIQEEVEYGENRKQPKQVLVDFTPKFIEKLSQQDQEQWFAIVKILLEGTEQKHILAYFQDPDLQKVAEANGFAGAVKKAENSDYLLITHSNVKGAKTDAVIDNRYALNASLNDDGLIEHKLTITRTHQGGKSDYGFYNRQSYDYIRVLVPKGATLLDIRGQSQANFSPLIRNYSSGDYVYDEDLKKYESGVTNPEAGVKQFEEADKTTFGFWLFLRPGETKAVTLKYVTPLKFTAGEYLLMVQKQPGTPADDLTFSFDLPRDKEMVFRYPPSLELVDSQAFFESKLVKDLIFGIKLQ